VRMHDWSLFEKFLNCFSRPETRSQIHSTKRASQGGFLFEMYALDVATPKRLRWGQNFGPLDA
jgi:hypothetical protein